VATQTRTWATMVSSSSHNAPARHGYRAPGAFRGRPSHPQVVDSSRTAIWRPYQVVIGAEDRCPRSVGGRRGGPGHAPGPAELDDSQRAMDGQGCQGSRWSREGRKTRLIAWFFLTPSCLASAGRTSSTSSVGVVHRPRDTRVTMSQPHSRSRGTARGLLGTHPSGRVHEYWT
jgi:hypothetical protein